VNPLHFHPPFTFHFLMTSGKEILLTDDNTSHIGVRMLGLAAGLAAPASHGRRGALPVRARGAVR
jgi:hypothetical protein